MITMDNYEEYMIMHADGELQPHEEQALMEFLAANPQLQGEMDIYSSICLVPDTAVVFEGKEKLLKPVAAPKIIPMPWYRSNYAVAAGVAAVVVLAAALMLRSNNAGTIAESNQLAANVPAANQTVNSKTPQATGAQPTNNTATSTPDAVENTKQTSNSAVQPAATVKQNNYIAAHTAAPKHGHSDNGNATTTNNQGQNLATTKSIDLVEMKQGGYKALPVEAAKTGSMDMASVDMPAIETAAEEKETWFDKLPIDERKKKNLSNVATAIASGCEKISTLKDNAGKFGFSMRVEKKNLIVSF